MTFPMSEVLKSNRRRKRLERLETKLEAVKKQIDEFPCIHVWEYQRLMRKIKKILEAEG